MIDTISIKIKIHNFQGEYRELNYFNELINKIEELNYCNIKKKFDDEIALVLSFPRFYSKTNAYLLTTRRECNKVIREFIKSFFKVSYRYRNYNKWIKEKIRIKLIRVDTPMTYFMSKDKYFNDYQNIFYLLENIYKRNSKRIGKKNEIETIILFDGKTKDSSNSKITIYNQYKKFENIYPKSINILEREFKDLKYRIRIELSKRINRKEFTIKEFKDFDFYVNYVYDYAQEIRQILFDEDEIERAWQNQIDLLIYRYKNSSNRLENFLWKNLNDIWDYEIIRKVLDRVIVNDNTYYKTCSQAKKFLEDREEETGIIYFGIRKILYDMKKACNLNRGGR
nr:hypothetical protein [uncultured Fusobacterium sp.]